MLELLGFLLYKYCTVLNRPLKGHKGFNYDTVIFGCARNSEKRRETIISSNQDMLTIIPSAMQVLKFLMKPHELPKFDNLYHLEQKNSIQS